MCLLNPEKKISYVNCLSTSCAAPAGTRGLRSTRKLHGHLLRLSGGRGERRVGPKSKSRFWSKKKNSNLERNFNEIMISDAILHVFLQLAGRVEARLGYWHLGEMWQRTARARNRGT